MKTVIITKADLIKAATEETQLQADHWNTEDRMDCPVCIVGSIFRTYLGITHWSTIQNYMGQLGDVGASTSIEEFHEKDTISETINTPFLNRLSMFFETLLRGNMTIDHEKGLELYEPITDYQRAELIKYIEDNAPDKIEVRI